MSLLNKQLIDDEKSNNSMSIKELEERIVVIKNKDNRMFVFVNAWRKYMIGKMTKNEKILASLSFILLIAAIAVKSILGTADTGVLVILAFAGILVWVILLVCAFFPADWRMTVKQKSKIANMVEYQNIYRKVMIGLDVFVAILFAVLVVTLG